MDADVGWTVLTAVALGAVIPLLLMQQLQVYALWYDVECCCILRCARSYPQ
jgi:hypothetical protein